MKKIVFKLIALAIAVFLLTGCSPAEIPLAYDAKIHEGGIADTGEYNQELFYRNDTLWTQPDPFILYETDEERPGLIDAADTDIQHLSCRFFFTHLFSVHSQSEVNSLYFHEAVAEMLVQHRNDLVLDQISFEVHVPEGGRYEDIIPPYAHSINFHSSLSPTD